MHILETVSATVGPWLNFGDRVCSPGTVYAMLGDTAILGSSVSAGDRVCSFGTVVCNLAQWVHSYDYQYTPGTNRETGWWTAWQLACAGVAASVHASRVSAAECLLL